MMSGNFTDVSYEGSSSLSCVCKNVKDLDKLYSLILELGKGLAGQGKDRFSVAIDMINEMLRHTSTSTVADLLSNLSSHDLHEVKVTSVIEYLSSGGQCRTTASTANGQRRDLEKLSFLEQNFGKGKLQVRFKPVMGIAKDFISISRTSILHLFHLKMNYSIKLIKAFCQRFSLI